MSLALGTPYAEAAVTQAARATATGVGAGLDLDDFRLHRPLGGWPKRLVDIVVACTGLAVAWPIMAMVAIAVRLSDGGPAIYAHDRVGFGGRSFRCYKFRSMILDSDRMLEEHLARDPEAAREWEESRKLRNDPRVGPLGRVLRKSSLDELPQLYNILRGDMSCVGPRPIVAAELERYGPFLGYYLRSRPGLTGIWQVTGRSSTDYASRVSLDSQYVRTWSLWADLVILCRTAVAVIRTKEAA